MTTEANIRRDIEQDIAKAGPFFTFDPLAPAHLVRLVEGAPDMWVGPGCGAARIKPQFIDEQNILRPAGMFSSRTWGLWTNLELGVLQLGARRIEMRRKGRSSSWLLDETEVLTGRFRGFFRQRVALCQGGKSAGRVVLPEGLQRRRDTVGHFEAANGSRIPFLVYPTDWPDTIKEEKAVYYSKFTAAAVPQRLPRVFAEEEKKKLAELPEPLRAGLLGLAVWARTLYWASWGG